MIKTARLLEIWVSASVTAFLVILVTFTLFFGRNKVTLNETIYEGHRFVGQPGKSQLSTREGYGLTTFGEDGLVINKVLDPAAFRVLFIGDSHVKARQVSDDLKFTQVVERTWNAAHPEKPIQTLNLGLDGQSIPTYLSFGRNMDKRFQPDLVFVMLSKDDFMYLRRHPEVLEQVTTGRATADRDTLILTEPEVASFAQRLINDLGFRSFFGQLQLQTYGFLSVGEANAQTTAPKREPSLEWNQAITTQLQALLDIWGDRLVILYRAPVRNMGRDEPAEYRDTTMLEMESLGIPYICLYPTFLKAFQERKPPYGFHNSILGSGHMNPYGHTLVAAEIHRYLEAADDLF